MACCTDATFSQPAPGLAVLGVAVFDHPKKAVIARFFAFRLEIENGINYRPACVAE
jgi:hypothetical protein